MYYQSKYGIYSYHYNIIGQLKTRYYPTITHFFKYHTEKYISLTVYHNISQNDNKRIDGECFTTYKTVIYDQDGNFYSPDRILGLFRDWKFKNESGTWLTWPSTGKKIGNYRGYRRPQTFQESKQWFNTDEYNITGRAGRSKCNLPEVWDDIRRHVEKSWKFQSKRKHQYKV